MMTHEGHTFQRNGSLEFLLPPLFLPPFLPPVRGTRKRNAAELKMAGKTSVIPS